MRPSPGIPLGASTQEIEMAKKQHVIEVLENVVGGQDREVEVL